MYYVDSKFNFSIFFVIFREKTKLREGVVARRQKKLMMRSARQKYLEEAALREAELLQDLDRFNSISGLSFILECNLFVWIEVGDFKLTAVIFVYQGEGS